ncbi:MAG TPA: peptidylprolyl isomerase [Candidatus Polarisedimenticolia bacterium]|nr:peptidylprolyl isomerase [Candidatus Polarisedimenticolia bacterium]
MIFRRPHHAKLLLVTLLASVPGCEKGMMAPAGGADGAAEGAAEPEMPVIAEVNGRPLYRPFYEQNLEYIRGRLSKDSASADVERYLNAKYEALDLLVQDELLYQDAVRQGLEVPDAAVQAEFRRAAQAAGGERVFLAGMRRQGIGRSTLLGGIRKRLTVDRLVAEVIAPAVQASEDEAVAWYNQHIDRFTPEPWVKASHILIRCPRDADTARTQRARSRAEQILQNIRSGRSFEEMAREFSEDSTAAAEGSLGVIKKGYAPPEFDAIAFTIPPGHVSEVVRTNAGFHIIKVSERIGDGPRPFGEVAEECRAAVRRRKQAEAVKALGERLRSTATIVSHLE